VRFSESFVVEKQ